MPGYAPAGLAPPSGGLSTRKKQVIALVVVLAVIGAGSAALVFSGALGGTGQCVYQTTDSHGVTTTSRYDGYTEAECDTFCANHLGHPCWWNSY